MKNNFGKAASLKGLVTKPQDFTAPCGCTVRFDGDGLVRLEQCPLHAMAADLHDVLLAIVKKSYLRPGKHEDCHVHPKLIEAGKMLLHNLKLAEAPKASKCAECGDDLRLGSKDTVCFTCRELENNRRYRAHNHLGEYQK